MNAIAMAKTVAEVRGWKHAGGGYIYSDDQVICQGWDRLATLLTRAGIIRDDRINWRRMDLWGNRRTVATLRAYR